MHDLRLVRGGLPGPHRARRHHRRDPPQPRPRGEPLPARAGRRLPEHGDRRQPLGPAAVGAARLGQGARHLVLGQTDAPTADTASRSRAMTDGAALQPSPHRLPKGSCTGSAAPGAYDERNRKVVRAMAALLRQAGVPFGVLGSGETCTGDPARRAGNEYLFQILAEENVATLPPPTTSTASGPSSPPARTASTPSATSTRSSAWAASRSSITPSCSRRWSPTAG